MNFLTRYVRTWLDRRQDKKQTTEMVKNNPALSTSNKYTELGITLHSIIDVDLVDILMTEAHAIVVPEPISTLRIEVDAIGQGNINSDKEKFYTVYGDDINSTDSYVIWFISTVTPIIDSKEAYTSKEQIQDMFLFRQIQMKMIDDEDVEKYLVAPPTIVVDDQIYTRVWGADEDENVMLNEFDEEVIVEGDSEPTDFANAYMLYSRMTDAGHEVFVLSGIEKEVGAGDDSTMKVLYVGVRLAPYQINVL